MSVSVSVEGEGDEGDICVMISLRKRRIHDLGGRSQFSFELFELVFETIS